MSRFTTQPKFNQQEVGLLHKLVQLYPQKFTLFVETRWVGDKGVDVYCPGLRKRRLCYSSCVEHGHIAALEEYEKSLAKVFAQVGRYVHIDLTLLTASCDKYLNETYISAFAVFPF